MYITFEFILKVTIKRIFVHMVTVRYNGSQKLLLVWPNDKFQITIAVYK